MIADAARHPEPRISERSQVLAVSLRGPPALYLVLLASSSSSLGQRASSGDRADFPGGGAHVGNPIYSV
jgi:hypothetical protein